MPLSVIFNTSRAWATMVSQLPIWEMPWPKKKRRKLRVRNERNVSLEKTRSRAFIADPAGFCVMRSSAWSASATRSRSSGGRSRSCVASHAVRRMRVVSSSRRPFAVVRTR